MLRIMQAALLAAVVVLFHSGVASSDTGACAAAKRELDTAREALSRAVRECDQASATYHACRQRGQGCQAEMRASRAALDGRRRATDAYRFAAGRAGQACR